MSGDGAKADVSICELPLLGSTCRQLGGEVAPMCLSRTSLRYDLDRAIQTSSAWVDNAYHLYSAAYQ